MTTRSSLIKKLSLRRMTLHVIRFRSDICHGIGARFRSAARCTILLFEILLSST